MCLCPGWFRSCGSCLALPNGRIQIWLFRLNWFQSFNSVERNIFLRECALKFPQIYKWVFFCYSQHSLLFFGNHTISSEAGVQQGDPLGSFLFCLASPPKTRSQNQFTCSQPSPKFMLHGWWKFFWKFKWCLKSLEHCKRWRPCPRPLPKHLKMRTHFSLLFPKCFSPIWTRTQERRDGHGHPRLTNRLLRVLWKVYPTKNQQKVTWPFGKVNPPR